MWYWVAFQDIFWRILLFFWSVIVWVSARIYDWGSAVVNWWVNWWLRYPLHIGGTMIAVVIGSVLFLTFFSSCRYLWYSMFVVSDRNTSDKMSNLGDQLVGSWLPRAFNSSIEFTGNLDRLVTNLNRWFERRSGDDDDGYYYTDDDDNTVN
jgi:hypothetical protein